MVEREDTVCIQTCKRAVAERCPVCEQTIEAIELIFGSCTVSGPKPLDKVAGRATSFVYEQATRLGAGANRARNLHYYPAARMLLLARELVDAH
jgi:hypothetical protein